MSFDLEPLELLYEPDGLPALPLPEALARIYRGTLGFTEPRLVANFVSTVDGVVAMPGVPGAVKAIRGESEADPFLMGLLRACADALLMGVGTFRASREARWVAESVYRPAAAGFAELRCAIGRQAPPELVVVTASGRLDPVHPALETGTLVLTTDAGVAALRGTLPAASELVSLGERIEFARVLDLLRTRGHRLLLSEGGPTLVGSLAVHGLLDELFLTLSPALAGRGEVERLSLAQGVELLPGRRLDGRLLGVRRGGAHLFLRFAFD